MAGSANFKSFGDISSGSSNLLVLMAFNLCSSSDKSISETEGAGHPKFYSDISNEFIHQVCLIFVINGKASLFRGPISLLLTGLIASAIMFQYAAADLTEDIFSVKHRDFAFLNSDVILFLTLLYLA